MTEIYATIKKVFRSTPRFSAGVMRLSKKTVREPTHCRPFGPLEEETFKAFGLIREGDVMILRGEWIDDPTYDHQFCVKSYEHDRFNDADGIVRFFADHRGMDGIGEVRAKKLVDKYGVDGVASVLCDDPEAFANAAGVSVDRAKKIREVWM